MNRGLTTTATDMINGKIAGSKYQRTDGGAPGSGASIRIRGGSSLSASNNPLIVIDGLRSTMTVQRGIQPVEYDQPERYRNIHRIKRRIRHSDLWFACL